MTWSILSEMETLLFWAVPIIVVLISTKSSLMNAWRLCFASTVSLYVGVWIAPAWWGLLDFLPTVLVPYRNMMALLISVAAIFAALYQCATAITPTSRDDTFVFPKPTEQIFNVLFRFVFGVALSTFLFVLCCATPLKLLIRDEGSGMQEQAYSALLKISLFADKITANTPETPREETLENSELWYIPPQSDDTEQKTAPEENSSPTAESDNKQ